MEDHSAEGVTQKNSAEPTANVNNTDSNKKNDIRLTIDVAQVTKTSSKESTGPVVGAVGGQLTVNCQDANSVEPPKLSPNDSLKGKKHWLAFQVYC